MGLKTDWTEFECLIWNVLEHFYMRPKVHSNWNLKSQIASIYMAIYMEILLRQLSTFTCSKALMHMYKWYLLIIANLINAKEMLRYWLFFKQ